MSSVSPLERDENGQNFEQLGIKPYNRSAADKKMNRVEDIRPPIVLYKTVEYLRECIADLDRLQGGNHPYN